MTKTTISTKSAPRKPAKASKAPAVKAKASGADNRMQAIWGAMAVLELDARQNVIGASQELCRLLGYDAEELHGMPYGRLLPADWARDEECSNLWQDLRNGLGRSGLQPRLDKRGNTVWLQVSTVPVRNASGETQKFVELCSDASANQEKLEDLKAELKVRTDIMNLTSLVSWGDKRGDILEANDKYSEVSEYSSAELIGNPHSINRHPDVPKAVFKEMWQTIARGEIFRGMIKNQKKSGSPYYVDAVIAPVLGKNGKPKKYIGSRYDITEREIARVAMEGLINAINRSQAMIEFNMDGTIITANENFCKTVGYTLDQIRGQHHSMFVDAAERGGNEYRTFWEKLNRGEFQSGEFRRIARDGRDVWLQASYNPVLDDFGKPIKVIKFASDISQRIAAVTDMGQLLHALAEGDLTHTLTADYGEEFASVMNDANRTVDEFVQVITQISQATDAITTAAAEIATGNTDLSQRTEEQASNLEETASSMEQLTATVKQNAENAQQANQLAATASEMAVKGGEVVSQVVGTMSAISDSSKKIVDIISVIDGIAFQTNILALNAAVEAARAGEQGRGFAVVASEVRNLAQRSAAAAKEIKDLIGDSVEKVGAGSKLVETAGQTMGEIVASVKRVTDIMGEITAASHEQSDGIEQVNQAIMQLDQVTQQNAALVEQSAAAAESMSEQARGLDEIVSHFKLDDNAGAAGWDGTERRGPDRATNVVRIASQKAPQRAPAAARPTPRTTQPALEATGTDGVDGGWESF